MLRILEGVREGVHSITNCGFSRARQPAHPS
jgi:hypothetical protein